MVRIALTTDQVNGLTDFPPKSKDPRYEWFVKNYGRRCWELDALDPNTLRGIVEREIQARIHDEEAWERCERVNKAEQKSLSDYLDKWSPRKPPKPRPKPNRPVKRASRRYFGTGSKKVGWR